MSTPKTQTQTNPDTTTWSTAGRNIRFTTIDNVLFIAVDTRPTTIAAAPQSASGKSKSVGSTLGNVGVPGTPLKFGVNVYTPA
jgi:hypothetical protein